MPSRLYSKHLYSKYAAHCPETAIVMNVPKEKYIRARITRGKPAEKIPGNCLINPTTLHAVTNVRNISIVRVT
jgi:hypothetical protein